MAKKKKSIDLSAKEIFFELEHQQVQVVRFYPSNMSVDIKKQKGITNLPFAHLPKTIKQQIKPK